MPAFLIGITSLCSASVMNSRPCLTRFPLGVGLKHVRDGNPTLLRQPDGGGRAGNAQSPSFAGPPLEKNKHILCRFSISLETICFSLILLQYTRMQVFRIGFCIRKLRPGAKSFQSPFLLLGEAVIGDAGLFPWTHYAADVWSSYYLVLMLGIAVAQLPEEHSQERSVEIFLPFLTPYLMVFCCGIWLGVWYFWPVFGIVFLSTTKRYIRIRAGWWNGSSHGIGGW